MTGSADDRKEISLADEDRVKEVLVDGILRLWEVVNSLTRLRPSKQLRYRVTIFGSARAQPGSFAYEETRRVARAMTELDCDIVTGGGPGLMSAANAGAADAKAGGARESVGIRVSLPFEQEPNAFVTQLYEHGTFFTRLHHFVLASNAFVVAPGGIGTVLEATMIWQLLQVGHLERTPLIFVGPMWRDLVQWARTHMLDPSMKMASELDLEIPRCVASGAEAIDVIREDHERWLREHAGAERSARSAPR